MKQSPICIKAFGVFVHWIYSQCLQDNEGGMPSSKELANLWIFADEKLIPRLQNQAAEALNEVFAKQPFDTDFFNHIYHHTLEGSALRRLVVHLFLGKYATIEVEDDLPRAMLVDLFNASTESKVTKISKLSKNMMQKYFVDEEIPERELRRLTSAVP